MQPIEIISGCPIPLPLLRTAVPAGFPSPANDFIKEDIDLQRLLVANRAATYLVRVAGDSMVEKQLHGGDLAVVDRSLSPCTGDVVVVDIEGERSFKVWQVRAGRIELAFRQLPLSALRAAAGRIRRGLGSRVILNQPTPPSNSVSTGRCWRRCNTRNPGRAKDAMRRHIRNARFSAVAGANALVQIRRPRRLV